MNNLKNNLKNKKEMRPRIPEGGGGHLQLDGQQFPGEVTFELMTEVRASHQGRALQMKGSSK